MSEEETSRVVSALMRNFFMHGVWKYDIRLSLFFEIYFSGNYFLNFPVFVCH
jgi:hypothetical protein